MMNKKISVVIPTYNEEKYIERCLKSLLNQTLCRDEFEIVVVDGKSTDKTVELAKNYADMVIQQKSKGVGGARNDGVEIAGAEIIATTDADTVLPKEWLERICADFDSKDVVAVYGPIRPIGNKFKYKFLIGLFNKFAHLSAKLRLFHATLGSNTSFRRSAFMKIEGYSAMPAGDDYEIVWRLKHLGKIYYDPDLIVDFSMRRLEQFGILRSMCIWTSNVIAAKRGKNPKVAYTHQTYK